MLFQGQEFMRQRTRLADLAEQLATTESALATTFEQLADTGPTEYRQRRLELAHRARSYADVERTRAERWRTSTS